MNNIKEPNTMIHSSQSAFIVMATLAGALSMSTTIYSREEQVVPSKTIEQTYGYSTTYVQEIRYYNPDRKNFHAKYAKMTKSQWYKKGYENKSVGDIIEVDY